MRALGEILAPPPARDEASSLLPAKVDPGRGRALLGGMAALVLAALAPKIDSAVESGAADELLGALLGVVGGGSEEEAWDGRMVALEVGRAPFKVVCGPCK